MTLHPSVDLGLVHLLIEILATLAFALSGLLEAATSVTVLRGLALLTGYQLPAWNAGQRHAP